MFIYEIIIIFIIIIIIIAIISRGPEFDSQHFHNFKSGLSVGSHAFFLCLSMKLLLLFLLLLLLLLFLLFQEFTSSDPRHFHNFKTELVRVGYMVAKPSSFVYLGNNNYNNNYYYY